MERAEKILAEAEAAARSIGNNTQRANALGFLSNTYASTGKYELSLHLVVQRAWLLAETREDALTYLPLSGNLISSKPELGTGIYQAFKWVDAFLRG
ncbi:MAG: hypothetical protein NVS4B12_29080 [Ktedonobacteraceae bacterium]